MTKVKFDFKKFAIKPILASIIMSIVSYATYYLLNMALPSRIATIIALTVAVITYFIAVMILKIFSEEEIKDLPKGENIHKMLVKLKIY